MQQSDFAQFKAVMNATAEMYGKSLSAASLALWWGALQDLDLPAVQSALSAHVNSPDNGQFMPRPADVRRHLSGTTGDAALLAWATVLKACRQVGAYSSVAFDDPVTMAVLGDMGWVTLCHSTEDEQPFREKEFVAKYRAYKGRGDLSYPSALLGIMDRENVAQGHATQEPVLIGNPERAREVIRLADGGALQITQKAEESRVGPALLKVFPLLDKRIPDRSPEQAAAEAEIAARTGDQRDAA